MTSPEVVYSVMLSLPTLFALWAKVEAAKAKRAASESAQVNVDQMKAITELKTALVTITTHIDGKMDALLIVSKALSKLEGIEEERHRQENKDK